MSTRTYRVIWAIDIEASSATEAAEQALAIQRNRDSIATVFDVFDLRAPPSLPVTVDLLSGGNARVLSHRGH